ncbi:maleylacetoacetate isomerase [Henriciella aquimarina]|uniref:maleylacetoacetate isomerase n=1 Tax=Henriciella aquimarina TaxID=545261 RepID=UPI0009FBF174|nr:maleylacetoacetate isomerase [Henriciella aquimarina]
MILHTYHRSTASWRVRIALALKGLAYEPVFQNLRSGDQTSPDYLKLNPQGLLPALVLDDGNVLTQSVAIIQYLDEAYPDPALLPGSPVERAHINAFALSIACDLHPVQNLRVLKQVGKLAGDEARAEWAKSTVEEGLKASAQLLPDTKSRFCFGDAPTLADIVLVPQLANARRFEAPIPERIKEIEANCFELAAFNDTRPETQPDAAG